MNRSKRKVWAATGIIILIALIFLAFKFDLYKTGKHHLKNIFIKPNISWEKTSPEKIGLSKDSFSDFEKKLAARKTKGFLIIKDDKIIYEWYAKGYHYNDKFGVASLSKATVGAPSLLIALENNYFKLDDNASLFIDEWKSDSAKSQIKIEQLASFISGFDDSRETGTLHGNETGWKKEYWEKSNNRFVAAINKAPVILTPGTKLKYSNPAVTSLGYIIAKSIKEKENKNFSEFLYENFYNRIGIPESDMQISYGKDFKYNNINVYEIGGGAIFTLRALARIGNFYLKKGNLNGNKIVEAELVDRAMSFQSDNQIEIPEGFPAPGLLGWNNNNGVFANIPEDAFIGMGANHEVLVVIPSMNLIAVRVGKPLNGTHWADYSAMEKTYLIWQDLEEYFLNPLMEILLQKN